MHAQHRMIYYKNNKNNKINRIITALIAAMLVVVGIGNMAMAVGQLTTRKVVLGSSLAGASTTYNFTFTAASATTIKSIQMQACDTASGACTTAGAASGFSQASSTLSGTSNLGSGGAWTVNTATSGSLRALNASNTGSPSAGITVNFASVVNPSATNSTFFLRITTYSDAGWATPIDSGVVATSTGGNVTVNASVDEALTFTIASQTVNLNTLTTGATGKGTSTMQASTNASHGYAITYSGTSLTDGSHPFTAMAGTASSIGTNQFGLNLKLNATPSVGSNPSGGSGTASAGYNTADSFTFNSGDTVASWTGASNPTTYTTSYIANIDAATPAGSYSTVLNYVATPNF
jgi:hypothetical protein